MKNLNRRVLLRNRPRGEPLPSDFELVEAPVPTPGAGDVLCRTIYLSLDPYMRGRMDEGRSYTGGTNPALGSVMVGGTVSEVIASRNPAFPEGTFVLGASGGQAYALSSGAGPRKLDARQARGLPRGGRGRLRGQVRVRRRGARLRRLRELPGRAAPARAPDGVPGRDRRLLRQRRRRRARRGAPARQPARAHPALRPDLAVQRARAAAGPESPARARQPRPGPGLHHLGPPGPPRRLPARLHAVGPGGKAPVPRGRGRRARAGARGVHRAPARPELRQADRQGRRGPERMKIADVRAYPTSFPVPPDASVVLGIGRTVKRDAVVVKVTTDDGLVGWGESHHGRAPGAVAHLVNTTLRQLALGLDAADVVGVWTRIYRMQLGSHGMGAGTSIAMSGLDLALWDIRGKATGWPLYRLLGGAARPIPAYAGGVSLGWQDPSALVDEARVHVDAGFRAVKLRLGDTPARDLERVAAVRHEFGPSLVILTDANTGYSVTDARVALPGLEAHGVGWLEEPFPAHDHRSYALAAGWSRVPLAAGENHYTRFEFTRVVEDDVSRGNLFRDALTSSPYRVDADGCVTPLERPGLGVEVDEDFLAKHPVIEGPSYV